jgi:hypothetical protein
MYKLNRIISAVIMILLFSTAAISQNKNDFLGKWTLIVDRSSEIALYRTLSLEFQKVGSKIRLIQKWGSRRSYSDTLLLKTDGSINKVPANHRVFPTNVFMGLSMPVGKNREIRANWEDNGTLLKMDVKYTVLGSQGASEVVSQYLFKISGDKETLMYTISRSTRKGAPEINYILKRDGLKNAYYMNLEDEWNINGQLDENAFLISLQGVANMENPTLYFIYPESWDFTYTQSVFDFYRDKRNYTFRQLRTAEQALRTFNNQINGYVVWDKSVRTSLIVAFTVCGLEKAVVVSEEMIPMMEKYGIKKVADFRGKFTGKSDAEIYKWAYDKYWKRCSRDYIIWMGGEHGNIMKPGVADWGIYHKAFFNDCSTKPVDVEEYNLSKKMLSQQNQASMVMGWHSYKKDKERDHVTLCSNYGLRVEGLHTIPNLSFSSQVPATPGFKYKNNHNIIAGKKYIPEDKVYITCVQTDGLGLGAWLEPGRGEIPYAWEVIMNYSWMAPAMMEYFYTMATPNDFFIGALSGPGYMYPKAVPPSKLPLVIKKAEEQMKLLDLTVFEIMDYSEGATVEGNTELTKEVVEAYYKGMPEAIGFVNGYAPAFTFANKNKRPLISYDYYLSPTRTEDESVADLKELAEINKKRPYFLLVHVREYSNITRVKNIINSLGAEFELVPLDVFLKMAGEKPTFKEKYLKK